jgi:type I restriction enzyme M protein
MHLLVERDARYYDFRPELNGNGDLKQRIEADPGLQDKELTLTAAFETWWKAQEHLIARLPETQELMTLRAELLASFEDALVPVGLLDRFQVSGAVATWWGDVQFDLKTLMARGFEGVVEGWATTIVTALEEGGKNDPLDHKLVKALLPQFLEEIAEAEAQVAELDSALKAATAAGEDEEEGYTSEDNGEALSEAEIKDLKRRLSAAKSKLKTLQQSFVDRLEDAQAGLDFQQAQVLVLGILKDDLQRELDRRVAVHRQAVVEAVENWWGKYRVTLRDIEDERDTAKERLDGFLTALGYVS